MRTLTVSDWFLRASIKKNTDTIPYTLCEIYTAWVYLDQQDCPERVGWAH